MFKRSLVFLLFICSGIISGCALLTKMVVDEKGIQPPNIVAYLEPVLEKDKIAIQGRIVVRNSTKTDIGLGRLYLELRDQNGRIVEHAWFPWETKEVAQRKENKSLVRIALDISELDNEFISIAIKTVFTYKKFHIRIPFENEISVLYLGSLKKSIDRPLDIDIHTTIISDIFGDVSLTYQLGIVNPLPIDLSLEDGLIKILAQDYGDIVSSVIKPILLASKAANSVDGRIDLGRELTGRVLEEIGRGRKIIFELTGKLRLPDTAIFMPFRIRAAQELDFSIFKKAQ